MDASALASAQHRLELIWQAKSAAAGLIIVCVVIQFVGDWFAKRYQQTVDRNQAIEMQSLKTRSLEAEAKTAAAGLRIEQLKADNLAFERLLAPRHWLNPGIRGATSIERLLAASQIWDQLAKHPGTRTLIQAVPDFEAQRLAAEITFGLTQLGWKPQNLDVNTSKITPLNIPEGVEVWTGPKESSSGWEAGEDLTAALTDQGITAYNANASLHRVDDGRAHPWEFWVSVPPGSVVLLIGVKPATYEMMQRQTEHEHAVSKP